MNRDDMPTPSGVLLPRWRSKSDTTTAESTSESTAAPVAVSAPVTSHRPPTEPVTSSTAESAIDALVESLLASVDQVLAGVPNPVPSSGQLRRARGRGASQVSSVSRRVQRPLLAGIGAADLIAEQLRQRLSPPVDPSNESSSPR